MAVTTVASVHQLAAALLTACDDILETTVGGRPDSVFLSPGLPALDRQCDTLTVYATPPTMQTEPNQPSGLPGSGFRFAWRNFVGLTALIARCVPVGGLVDETWVAPSEIALTAAADKTMEDMWALWNGIGSNLTDIFEEYPCQGVAFTGLTPLDPQGGFAGWVLALQVELGGYEVTIP